MIIFSRYRIYGKIETKEQQIGSFNTNGFSDEHLRQTVSEVIFIVVLFRYLRLKGVYLYCRVSKWMHKSGRE